MKKILISAIMLMTSVMTFAQVFHDAALFNAPFDRVKCIYYGDGCVYFTENGKIDKLKSTYLALYDTYKIKRDADGYPISVVTNFDKTTIEYDANKRIKKRIVKGNGTVIITYEYFSSQVKETRITSEGGQTKKQEIVYNVCDFDYRGNWIKKGIFGTLHNDTEVENEDIIGSVYSRQIVTTTNYYVGRTNENRFIAYWSGYNFKKSDSPKEVSLLGALKDPFFIGMGLWVPYKELKKKLKAEKINCSIKKIYYSHNIYMDTCDRLIYGFPIIDLHAEYYNIKWWGRMNYDITIAIADKAKRDDFFVFLMEELQSQKIPYELILPKGVSDYKEVIEIDYNMRGYTEERIKELDRKNLRHKCKIKITKNEKGVNIETDAI